MTKSVVELYFLDRQKKANMPRYLSRFWSLRMTINNNNTQPNTRKRKQLLSLALSSIIFSQGAIAEDDSMWDMSLEDLGSVRITTLATGTATPLDKAAAVATVITEDDILAMGATDINEVLETVPGLHVGRSDQGFTPKFNIRGITSANNAQTLVLINGVPITTLFTGNRSQVWGGMPVKAIKRIEVIRGPGSALYGADAFSGVINIVTKSRKDINGTNAGVRVGSFDTKASWIEHGGTYNDFDLALSLEYQSTDGWDEIATAAGGPVNTSVKSTEMRFDISKGNWSLRAGYQGRRDLGLGIGLLPVLDSEGNYHSDRINLDSSYNFKNLAENFDLETRVSYYYNTQEIGTNPTLLPAGALPAFPDGVIGTPGMKEQQARIDLSALYTDIKNHRLRVGLGGFWGDIFETTEKKNFNIDISLSPAPPFAAKGSLVDVSDTNEVFLPEEHRTNYYFFLQDEWQLADNWALTSGIRYDHYSDFGDTTNPRLALVWATTDSITTKLLYGRAFRAPSIAELFATGNPVATGNPDLDPETIDTYELAFSHQVNRDFRYSANIYYYDIEDYIFFIPGGPGQVAQNRGNRKGKGGEFEFDYSISTKLTLAGNYAFQKATDNKTNTAVGEAPNHQAFLRTEWKANEKWVFSPQVNWVGKQRRVNGDTRAPVDHYTTVDLTMRQKQVTQNLDISLSIRNLFDRDVFEASAVDRIASDFPMAGRSIYGELAYSF